MKSLLRTTVLLAVATGIAAAPVQAGARTLDALREGTQSGTLEAPQPVRESARTEAIEFFWYDCGHSRQLEAPLQAWEERHREDVALTRVPAVWQGSPEEGAQRGHARLYYTLERLGLVGTLQVRAFRAVNQEDTDLTTEATATAWAVRQGVDGRQFAAAYRSAEVEQGVTRAVELFRTHRIDELPTVVVQGRYRTSPTGAGSVSEMPAVLDRLVEQDQQSRR